MLLTAWRSSSVKGCLSPGAAFASAWRRFLAPGMTVDTAGLSSTNLIANRARLSPSGITERRASTTSRSQYDPGRHSPATGKEDPMARLQRKRFSSPAEVRTFPHGKVDVVELDDVVVGRMTYEPGWRWSVDVKPIAGTDSCQFHHLGIVLSGRLRGAMADGTELEVGPGDVFEMPPGHDAWVVGDEPWVCVDFAAMRNYGRTAEHRGERILASILFTDIVDSTATAQKLGDSKWLDVIAAHNERVQFILNRFSGRIVKTTGDGVLALFDGAERAVRAAAALHHEVAGLGIQLRAGINTGEVEVVPGDVRGVAIHAAARVMAIAQPGETLVSSTTRDLLDGTGLEFADRGSHMFKGLPGKRTVFALKPVTADIAPI
jgi:class 3 adenylate cyclase